MQQHHYEVLLLWGVPKIKNTEANQNTFRHILFSWCTFPPNRYRNRENLPSIWRFQLFLTMIDLFFRWPEAISIPDTTSKTSCGGIFKHWITRYSYPSLTTTDQVHECDQWCFLNLQKYWDTQVRITVYHTISKGIIEIV